MPHLDPQHEDLVQREQDGHLQQHRQTARQRVHAFRLEQLLHFLLLLDLVILVLGLQLFHLRLNGLHRGHTGEALLRDREKRSAHDHGQADDGHTEVARQMEQLAQKP